MGSRRFIAGEPPRARARGFTLIELLVVIGIIAVLMAILMPALVGARRASQATKCLSQVRQIGISLMMYAHDNRDWGPSQPNGNLVIDFANPAVYQTPGNENAWASLLPYLSNVKRMLYCPSTDAPAWEPAWAATPFSDATYLVNGAAVGRKLSQVRRAAEVIYVHEQREHWGACWLRPRRLTPQRTYPGLYTNWCWLNPGVGGVTGQEYNTQHEGYGNLMYCDGHAEKRHNTTLRAKDYGLTGGAGANGNADDPNTVDSETTYRWMWD